MLKFFMVKNFKRWIFLRDSWEKEVCIVIVIGMFLFFLIIFLMFDKLYFILIIFFYILNEEINLVFVDYSKII